MSNQTTGVETCACDTCVYKTVAAKAMFLHAKERHPTISDSEAEKVAAGWLGAAVATERDRRAGLAD